MIAKLQGILDTLQDNGAIINVGGVGYFIFGLTFSRINALFYRFAHLMDEAFET